MAFKRIIAVSAIVAASAMMVSVAWANPLIADNPTIKSYTTNDEQSFVGIGYPITNDMYGSQGRAQFSDMVSALEEQGYIKEKSEQLDGSNIYEKPSEFWQCIKIDGCGQYYWIGKNGNEIATIKLVGKRNGVGHLEVVIKSI
ncbi:hypothetical protein [uncultured Shewanella sp.]|uniref:hypothetical protein n=1 Tax=uncultured Shewanella sp. TaxID=173975 RepID=UPI0026287BBD|nr:hypothetical protein [uncultured Shewanella sp.]